MDESSLGGDDDVRRYTEGSKSDAGDDDAGDGDGHDMGRREVEMCASLCTAKQALIMTSWRDRYSAARSPLCTLKCQTLLR